jgi:hypothetical protein
VVAAELADLLKLVTGAELADLLKLVTGAELAAPQCPAEEAETLDFQSSEEEAAVAGSVTAAESLTHPAPRCPLDGCLAERLLHARAKDGHHHLLERSEESFVVLAKHVVCRFLEYSHALLFFLLSCGIALPWQQHPGHVVLQIRDTASILLERQQTFLLKLVHDVLELLPLLGREIFKVDIHEVCDFGHLESIWLWSHWACQKVC